MIDSAQKRGELIGHLEAALELADELNGGRTGFLIEQALDEARAQQFKPLTCKPSDSLACTCSCQPAKRGRFFPPFASQNLIEFWSLSSLVSVPPAALM